MEDPPHWRENGSDRSAAAPAWRTLWDARDLIRFFTLRDLRVRYAQAGLGVVWVLIQPVATVAVFTLVFSRLARIGSDGIPYPLFALAGMISWTYFATAVAAGSESLASNPQLVTKVAFPRLAAPAAAMLPPLADLAVSLVLVAALALYFRVPPGWGLLALPLWLGLGVLVSFGVSLWLAALNVRFRDVRHALTPLLQVWLFASPVAYPSSLLSGGAALAYGLNPMAGVIGLARWSLIGAPWPGVSLLVSVASTLAVLFGGLAYFRRAQRSFADVI